MGASSSDMRRVTTAPPAAIGSAAATATSSSAAMADALGSDVSGTVSTAAKETTIDIAR
jgi:hypothetical protein